MLFNSWPFLIFLVCTFTVYYLIPLAGGTVSVQVGFLVLASFVFYGFDGPWLTLLLGGSVLVNVYLSRQIVHRIRAGRSPRGHLAAGATVNLLILGFFKYAGFLAEVFLPGEGLAGVRAALKSIPLPIGISFFTFHMISLLVDLVRLSGSGGVASLEQEYLAGRTASAGGRVALYVALFPQLIAGPILKAHEFFGQVRLKRFGEIEWAAAGRLLVLGYFLKMVVADNLREATGLLTTPLMPRLGALDLWALLYGFSFQIFADFAGYSLIALGLGKLFGYQLPTNFNFPYLAASITEFWRRWHISLSSWLRQYLYIPLGGSRRGEARTYVNLFLVMFLGGLWHGAAWSYAIWGTAHGLFLAGERLLATKVLHKPEGAGTVPASLFWRLLRAALVFQVVSVLWVLFLMPDFSQAALFFQHLVTQPLTGSPQTLFVVAVYGAPVVLGHVLALGREAGLWPASWMARARRFDWLAYAVLLFFIVTNPGATGAFIYFQF
jgi:alginate O-acetyltransferase complex protein AlgI